MRRYCGLVLFTFAATAFAAPPEVPSKIEAQVTQIKRIDVTPATGKEIGYQVATEDDAIFFDELAPRDGKRRFVFQAMKPGTYAIVFWTKDETSGKVCTITVGGGGGGGVKNAPQVSAVANATLTPNSSTGPLAVTVSDAETPLESLRFTVTSSDPSVISPGNITLGGSGANRTIQITSNTQLGTSTISLTVTNNANLSTSVSFVVTVRAESIGPIDPVLVQKFKDALAKDVAKFGAGDKDHAKKLATVYANAAKKLEIATSDLTVKQMYESMFQESQAAQIPRAVDALTETRTIVNELPFASYTDNTVLSGATKTQFLALLKQVSVNLVEAAK